MTNTDIERMAADTSISDELFLAALKIWSLEKGTEAPSDAFRNLLYEKRPVAMRRFVDWVIAEIGNPSVIHNY
jgi:hypothetical protein